MSTTEKKIFERFGKLSSFPPPDRWDDWEELDAKAWPRQVKKNYRLIPTVCFNCEAACGLLAYIDKDTGNIRKLEGHPLHPASRGRNCAKGPATIGQVTNPDRVLYPMRRKGERGGGQWERVSWNEVLDDLGGRIRKAIQENRKDEVVYHVGRPGEDMFTERVLSAWGVDGHNSHTNVCSSGARTGYMFWMGMDRPAPDYTDARFILMLSAHLESGHYFNPNAQRIIEAKQKGTKICVIDTRLSNTASRADYWMSPWPGTETALLLAIANYLIQNDLFNAEYVRKWVNWDELLADRAYLDFLHETGYLDRMPSGSSFKDFVQFLKDVYRSYTFEWAEAETGVKAQMLEDVAKEVARAGSAFSSNIWRNAAAGHRGGWMIARALFFINVLMGAVGKPGSMLPNSWVKFVPGPFNEPHQNVRYWNENHFPKEFPLANFEMGFCLPDILQDNGKRLEVYFTRVLNPVWTFPNGFAWIDMLSDESKVGIHAALTPTWSETAQYADYVLPMGLATERHDLHSYETHAAQWIGFRQPVLRVAKEQAGEKIEFTYQANPGEVWEENEFWIELSWRIDPDGSMGIRKYFESPYRPGSKITIEEYYRWIFENSVPGLPEAAAKEGLSPMEYMRRYGTFQITTDVFSLNEKPVPEEVLKEATIVAPADHNHLIANENKEVAAAEEAGVSRKPGVWAQKPPKKINFRPYPGPFKNEQGDVRVGIVVDGKPVEGFPTPSGKLEFFSTTLKDWNWKEYAIPIYPRNQEERKKMPHVISHVHPESIDRNNSEFILLPTFRLPTLIHTRTNGAKWLYEISHANPIWLSPVDAKKLGVTTGDLVKLSTEVGYFVDKVWVTEGIRPGVIACSHHLGRWRLHEDQGSDRWNSSVVRLQKDGTKWRMKQVHGPTPFKSDDPDSERIWWTEGGVHQNLIFPAHPDPISGMMCWHQKVRALKASADDQYGDVQVDTQKAHEVYHDWLKLTRPAPGPGGMRRPYWMMRPLKPHPDYYKMPTE
ncbi:molybdopterin-dependent oxidoreductase [Ferviditalea candida]|uniref:Molybdopterin-dependent oxidoreductase n=1 Tax=Ferviditalea candida TaxID=3108399 RepID=A0ABU5ZHG1_9BACL|nr:molybdopterin-dependent oxidoreductase [Paenibacillaceae bacterium T2]